MALAQGKGDGDETDLPHPSRKKRWWQRLGISGIEHPHGLHRRTDEDFLPRSFRIQRARLIQLLNTPQDESGLPDMPWPGVKRLLDLDPFAADYADLYELELAIVRVLPDGQLDLALATMRQRYVDVVGKQPDNSSSHAPQLTTEDILSAMKGGGTVTVHTVTHTGKGQQQ